MSVVSDNMSKRQDFYKTLIEAELNEQQVLMYNIGVYCYVLFEKVRITRKKDGGVIAQMT